MEFKKGDKVVILANGGKPSYNEIINCWGTIATLRKYKSLDGYEETVYYVEIPNQINKNQISGFWCCDEDMLEPYDPTIIYKNSINLACIDDPICSKRPFNENEINEAIEHLRKRFNNKGENKMEILNIYRERKLEKLEKKNKDNKATIIKKCDAGYKYLTELADNLLNNFDDNVKQCITISLCEYDFKDTIRKALEENHEKYLTARYKLNALCDEVNAQLDMCETYKQKQDILKRYEILKDGKINA